MTDDGGRAARVGSTIVAEAMRFIGAGNVTGSRGPWCGDFASLILQRTGHRPLAGRMAASALAYGPRTRNPKSGDLIVMRGHVGFFAGWEHGRVLMVSGNWGRRVARATISPLAIAALANADMESAFKTAALGDDGTAHSLWQWHGDRAARILAGYGVDVTTETSVVAVTGALVWDISTVKAYQPAFAAMKAATTAEEAAMIFCEKIEGAGAPGAKERRAADAAWWTVAIAEHANFFNAPPPADP